MITLLQLDVFTHTKTTLASRSPPPTEAQQSPKPQSGSVLCPLVMDYCKGGGGRGAVCVTLVDEANSAGGFPGNADNDGQHVVD